MAVGAPFARRDAGQQFQGLVDVALGKAFLYDDQGNVTEAEIPEEMRDAYESAREELYNAAADTWIEYLGTGRASGEQQARIDEIAVSTITAKDVPTARWTWPL